jgi:hypothetical protein
MATWEDINTLCQKFPRAFSWGQEDLQARGIFSGPTPSVNVDTPEENDEQGPTQETRPKRMKKKPNWLAG